MQPLNLDELDDAPTSPPPQNEHSTRAHARTEPESPDDVAAWCFEQHTRRHGLAPLPGGGHNGWLAAVVKFCNEKGADEADTLAHALSTAPAGHDEAKITATVKGIYRRDAASHGSKPYTPGYYSETSDNKAAFSADSGQKENRPPTPPPFTDTPIIPQGVYDALPDVLQRAAAPFTIGRERDVLLTGALAVLSGCFPGLGGIYDGTRYGANLFAFIVAPPASGKGALRWARALATAAHEARVLDSKRAREDYDLALADHAQAKRLLPKGHTAPPEPAEPPFKLLFIPGNNSAAGILKTLHENDGHAIICETEADTLSGALKQDWGNFSDLLRKAFHHEPASANRKTNREYLEVGRPCLSLALTGTPGQVVGLIPNGENGLFSRILFYCYDTPATWRDVGPGGGRGELDSYFAALGHHVHQLMSHTPGTLPDGTGGAIVELRPDQWDALNATGRRWLQEGKALAEADGAAGVVFRLGLSMFRVAVLLTLLRTFENGQSPAGQLTVDDVDLNTALALGDVYLAHALALLARMPRPTTGLTAPRGKWADKASKEVRAQELHATGLSVRVIADLVGIHYSTVSRWLNQG
jgi:hypothetical protein